MNDSLGFSERAKAVLGYYVYFLRHPETKDILYVGKGVNNRVFDHIKEAKKLTEVPSLEPLNQKKRTLIDLNEHGLGIDYVIHRYGLTENEALAIEAALIDFIGLDNLCNEVSGTGPGIKGPFSVDSEIDLPPPENVKFSEPSILVVNDSYYEGIDEDLLWELTHVVSGSKSRLKKAKYAFAIFRGRILQVYKIKKWHRSYADYNRYTFQGTVADELKNYIGLSVSEYIASSDFNRIVYINC